jgi:hypothetical protein
MDTAGVFTIDSNAQVSVQDWDRILYIRKKN